MIIKQRHISQITKLLNQPRYGWRGFRKQIAQRVYENGEVGFNYPIDDSWHDLHDKYDLANVRGHELNLVDGRAVLDIWIYGPGEYGELETQELVYLRRIKDDYVLVSLEPISDADILRAAVALAA